LSVSISILGPRWSEDVQGEHWHLGVAFSSIKEIPARPNFTRRDKEASKPLVQHVGSLEDRKFLQNSQSWLWLKIILIFINIRMIIWWYYMINRDRGIAWSVVYQKIGDSPIFAHQMITFLQVSSFTVGWLILVSSPPNQEIPCSTQTLQCNCPFFQCKTHHHNMQWISTDIK